MNLKDDSQSEIRIISEKMDKINEANLNIPNLSSPFSRIRGPFNSREELTNPFITDSNHHDKKQVLMKESPQHKKWPKFTGEGEYDHMSFIKTIDMFQEDYSITDESITAIIQYLFQKLQKDFIME
ncbi:hypothetical protein O181_072201 [Austropuccinia psidii MF-1]|uniref:Uncharacterized protein n=1 Tax=Austropuccinia psidii MF-1 TaxID=1389203 RepID=A0A9Q3F277_9BASI|nr:hypothetical protein [Austropuccinia psidii MF-1]